MATDRLTPLDASFLHLEDQNQPMHVGGVLVFEGDAPAYDDFVGHIESRLAMVPRYRQRLAPVPLGQGRPKWTDDEEFDVCFHVRSTAIPSPGGERELKRLASRIFAAPLNRDKPLWEMWLIEGLEGDRFAVLSKTHHAVVDGISGLDILSVLFADADDERARESRDWQPQPAPGGLQLLAEALIERATQPAEIVRLPWRLLRKPRQAAQKAFEYAVGAGALAWAGMQPAPRTPYNARLVGTSRRFTWVRGNLDDVKQIKNELGGTVNDVALAVVTAGLRRLLVERGEDPPRQGLRAMVPVNVRDAGERLALGNRVSSLFVHLPVATDSAAARYAATVAEAERLKAGDQAAAGSALVGPAALAPPVLHSVAARSLFASRLFNVTVTNVPGPQLPLYAFGCPLLEIVGLVPLAASHCLGVAVLSYNGNVTFGLVADRDTVPDLHVLRAGIEDELAELRQLAGLVSAPAKATARAAAAPRPASERRPRSRRAPTR
jgi:WS/DGAT/MGAT family acyltransferase